MKKIGDTGGIHNFFSTSEWLSAANQSVFAYWLISSEYFSSTGLLQRRSLRSTACARGGGAAGRTPSLREYGVGSAPRSDLTRSPKIRLAAVSRRQGRLAAQRRDQRFRRWTAPGPPPGYGRPWRPPFDSLMPAGTLPTLNGVRPGRQRRRAPAIAPGVWSRQRFALRLTRSPSTARYWIAPSGAALPPKGATSDFAAGSRPGLRPVMAACDGPPF